ncbi:hypothetical protein FACS1894219_08400 [Clostridia bacterium]|nr:hypothetical protein FACS1894219_08400 [Clostridia bacterium]
MTFLKTKLLPMFTLMFLIGVFFFTGATTAYAVTEPPTDGEDETVQTMGGIDEPVSEIQFDNPYAVPQEETVLNEDADPVENEPAVPEDSKTESSVPIEGTPFTPDGTGTVIDNTINGDGKEFFTIETPDGNVFYLIIDRDRTLENVYLLNAVTEYDLASLAKSGDGKSETAVPTVTPPESPETPEPSTEEPPAPSAEKSGTSTAAIVLIVIAALAVGGAGYYFKIVRPKQNPTDDDSDNYDEDSDEDDTYDDEPDEDEQDEDEEMPLSDDSESEDSGK